jgi:hypothetical protein
MKKVAGVLLVFIYSFKFINEILGIGARLEGFYNGYIIGPLDIIYIYIGPFLNIAFVLIGIILYKDQKIIQVGNINDVQVNATQSDNINVAENDKPSTGLNIISFLIPLVGLIIYLTQKDQFPVKAKSSGKSALWGVGVSFALGIITFIISLSMINSMY